MSEQHLCSSAPRIGSVIVLTLVLLAVSAAGQAASVAGKVVFATGNPVAVDGSGTTRGLTRGDEVYVGDTLKTSANGRLQVSFIDGAYVSIQPDSEYGIEDYQHTPQQGGEESSITRLIKGGIRAVTGLIGKEKPDAYKVKTSAATIGIRGTGFNTRICQGDCPGQQNGLYHNTWEGITYVFNNADSVEVPAGRGIYVRNMNTPIQVLGQPPGITALDTAGDREDEQRDDEDASTVVAAGDQRNSQGQQTVIVGDSTFVPTSSTTLRNQVHTGVSPNPDHPATPSEFSGTGTTVFANTDGFVGLVTDERQPGGAGIRTLGTINPGALLGADDAASAAEAESLLGLADATAVTQFQSNPAGVAESVVNPVGLAWGRWAGGNVLIVQENGLSRVEPLTDFQSLHFIFGPEPVNPLPLEGRAVYEFIGGTRSTAVSGASIGEGVTGGYIGVDFASSGGFIAMNVLHDNTDYAVGGELAIDAAANRLFDQAEGVFAHADAAGSACNPQCSAHVSGSFTGPSDGSGRPGNIGIEYRILETDVITGVAGFHLYPTTSSTVLPGLGLIAAVPDGTGGFAATSGAAGFGFANAGGDLIGAVYSPAGDPSSWELKTVDPDAVLGGDDLHGVARAGLLLARADQGKLESLLADPASVAESGKYLTGIGWGRWAGGRVLTVNDGGQTTLRDLTGNQSEHFVYGMDPMVIPQMGFATYGFAGGTRSTSASGDTIGDGVMYGDISVDFGTSSGYVYLDVLHGGFSYYINGPLDVNTAANRITDRPGLVDASVYPGIGSACSDGCPVSVEGRFFGPADMDNNPANVGIEYTIQENDPINGAAAFSTSIPAGT